MITVHHLENSRSQRILWMLEELGVEYEVRRYERDKKSNLAPPELKQIHPTGKSPVIDDDGVVVAETGAILEYLVAKHGNGRMIPAADTPERLRYTYWMHAGEGSVMPFMVMSLVFSKVETSAPWFIRPIATAIAGQVRASYIGPSVNAMLAHMEAELGKSAWFAGDELTAADVMMSFPLEAASKRVEMGSSYPKLTDFVKRVHARPQYQAALKRGGPYDYAS